MAASSLTGPVMVLNCQNAKNECIVDDDKKKKNGDKMRSLLSWDLLFCMVDMVRLSLLVTYIILAKMTQRSGSLSN